MDPQLQNGSTLPVPQSAAPTGGSFSVPPQGGQLPYGAMPLQNGVPQPLSPSAVEAGITTDDIQTMGAASEPVAGGNGSIDATWVIKAKQIMLSSAADPHLQHQQLMQLKAEYLQRQYNKTIKLV